MAVGYEVAIGDVVDVLTESVLLSGPKVFTTTVEEEAVVVEESVVVAECGVVAVVSEVVLVVVGDEG